MVYSIIVLSQLSVIIWYSKTSPSQKLGDAISVLYIFYIKISPRKMPLNPRGIQIPLTSHLPVILPTIYT